MLPTDRPRLRPHLTARADDPLGRQFLLSDRLRLSDTHLCLSAPELGWVQLFDGSRTVLDVQGEATRMAGGQPVPLEHLQGLAHRLDEALFLDGPRFRSRADDPVRPPACLGCYEPEPGPLRRQLRRLFTARGGPGLPGEPRPDGRLRAALVPHIDYDRGGVGYGWGFKELIERTPASLFVIVGTSHHSRGRFTLTRKHFRTPLGVAETDQVYVDRLAAHHGGGLFDDELMAHLPEHSIELEVVLLQYLMEGKRPFRIVPLVVGSFHDFVQDGAPPREGDDVARMARALRAAEKEAAEPVCYLISGDLAHVGPKFGDPRPLAAPDLADGRARDGAILRQAEAADPAGLFQLVADEGDRRRVCGLPPAYTVLKALRPSRGRVAYYGQYAHPLGYESVSFASVHFER
jgi:AmmeMemoRadiSam system protein B